MTAKINMGRINNIAGAGATQRAAIPSGLVMIEVPWRGRRGNRSIAAQITPRPPGLDEEADAWAAPATAPRISCRSSAQAKLAQTMLRSASRRRPGSACANA